MSLAFGPKAFWTLLGVADVENRPGQLIGHAFQDHDLGLDLAGFDAAAHRAVAGVNESADVLPLRIFGRSVRIPILVVTANSGDDAVTRIEIHRQDEPVVDPDLAADLQRVEQDLAVGAGRASTVPVGLVEMPMRLKRGLFVGGSPSDRVGSIRRVLPSAP